MKTNLATTLTYRRLVGGVLVSEQTYSLLTDVQPAMTLEQFKALTTQEVAARAKALEESIPVCADYERKNEPWKEEPDPDPIYDWVDVGQGYCEVSQFALYLFYTFEDYNPETGYLTGTITVHALNDINSPTVNVASEIQVGLGQQGASNQYFWIPAGLYFSNVYFKPVVGPEGINIVSIYPGSDSSHSYNIGGL